MKDIVEIYKSETEQIRGTNIDMQEHIDGFHKEQSTEHFEDVANITVNSDSIFLQGKQNGDVEDFQVNTYN